MATCTITTRKGLEVITETMTSNIAEMINGNFHVLGDHLEASNPHSVDHSDLATVTANQHHNEDHAARHDYAGDDELDLTKLKVQEVEATDNFYINTPANRTLRLRETVYDDIQVTPGAFQFAGTGDPSIIDWQPGGGGATFKVYAFQNGDEVFFTVQMPHSWKEETDLLPHIHWTPHDRGVAESGNGVVWKLDYSWASLNGVFGASSTVTMADTVTGADDHHEISNSAASISGTGQSLSSILICRLYRDGDDALDDWAGSTANNSPVLLEFDFHFEIDAMGSSEERAK